MNKFWIPTLLAVVLVGCSSDKTLDGLIPRNSLAVVLVDHPSLAVQALGKEGGIPWKALETSKPWAASAVPANPPGFLLALALSEAPTAWADLKQWAQERGGLSATRIGTYAVLYSPGLPEPQTLDPDRRFDLARVRAGGDPIAVYVDVKNVVDEADFPEAMKPAFFVLPWAEKNLDGVRFGFAPKDGGLEFRVATDWKAGATGAEPFLRWTVPADPAAWSGLLPRQGVGAVLSLPTTAWKLLMPSGDPALAQRWAALAPLLGPRLALNATPQPAGALSWSLVIEAQDVQAVRQALKTLVAGGDLQKSFPQWAMDADTPLIYQDRPDGSGGVMATLHLGAAELLLGYGTDRVVLSGGPGATEALANGRRATSAPAAWASQAPPGATALVSGSFDGLAAKSAFRVLSDANLEWRVWMSAEELKTWQERLPQAVMQWLSGEGGLTRLEP